MQTATLVTLRMRPTVSCTSSFDYNWWLTLICTVLLQYTINSLKALYHFSTATTHNRPFNINNNQLKCTWLKVHTESRSYNTVSFVAIHQKLASAAYLSVKSLTTSPRWDLLLLHVLQDESNVWTGSGGRASEIALTWKLKNTVQVMDQPLAVYCRFAVQGNYYFLLVKYESKHLQVWPLALRKWLQL